MGRTDRAPSSAKRRRKRAFSAPRDLGKRDSNEAAYVEHQASTVKYFVNREDTNPDETQAQPRTNPEEFAV